MTRLLPILLLCGCQSDTFTDAAYLSRPAPGPVAQARRDALAKALGEAQTRQVARMERRAHFHRLATNSIFAPIPLAKPGDASISTEDADPKRVVITPANRHATNSIQLPK